MSTVPPQLFRQEALEHHGRGDVQGSLLQLTPLWARAAYWSVLGLSLTLGIGLAFVQINEYAEGPVIIQVKGLEDITSTAAGRVSRLLVKPGQWVRAGDPLVELYAQDEAAEMARADQEFRTQLASRLMDPLNSSTQQSLAGLRAQLSLREARLAERTLKAPMAGWVRELRVREGQYLGQGELVATLMREDTESYAVGLVPGQYRPLLRPGEPMRLELRGFSYLYQDVPVTSVSDELVGPTELKRYLGPDAGDVVSVEGPVVVVQARLPRDTFRVQGYSYRYYSGMPGTARVRVRSRNGWTLLVPALDFFRRERD